MAERLNYPQADFLTVQARRTVIVDIEMNDHIRRDTRASHFDLDLSAVAEVLAASGLPQPVVIGVEKDETTVLTAGGVSHALSTGAWFASPGEIPPGTRATFDFRLSWRVIPGLLLFLAAPVAVVGMMLVRLRKRGEGAANAPVSPGLAPEEVQRRYDRGAPVWLSTSGLMFAPLVLLLALSPGRMMAEVNFLLPVDPSMVMMGVAGIAVVTSFLTSVRGRRDKRAEQSPSAEVAVPQSDQPPAWASMGWLGVLGLGMLAGPVFFMVPVYTPQAQTWMRYGVFGWMGLCVVGAVVVGWLGRRACRTELKSGPWFEMVADLAGRAKVPVRHVVLVKSPLANAFASPLGTVGLTTSLVRQLTPEEIRAVVAHELGHLKLRHPQRTLLLSLTSLSAIYGAWWATRGFLLPLAGSDELRVLLNGPFFIIFAAPMLQMLLIGRGMRTREEQADRLAVEWTGDPDLVIRAIERIHHLNQAPTRLKPSDEAISTHPSLAHRVEAIRALGQDGSHS